MAMVRMFVSEWQGFAHTVRAAQAEVPMLSGMPGSAAGGRGTRLAESARLRASIALEMATFVSSRCAATLAPAAP